MEGNTIQPESREPNPIHNGAEIVIHANYELFIVGLLFIQLINSILWLVVNDPEQSVVLEIIGGGIGVFLLLDAFYRLYKSPSKKRFLGEFHGWLAILGSVPVPFFCLLRLLWYWLMARKLKADDYRQMRRIVVEQRARSTLLVVLLAAILVTETASELILRAEDSAAEANIHTASDAIWWSLVTVATVGYGDKYPVTDQGRMVGVALMIVGVGLFGVFTSYLAQWFVAPRNGRRFSKFGIADDRENDDLRYGLDEIKQLLDSQAAAHQESTASLQERLEAIEKRLN